MVIDKLRTTPYKAPTIAVSESFHRTLNSMLGKVMSGSDWDVRLPHVKAAHRASTHSSTGLARFAYFGDVKRIELIDLVSCISVGDRENADRCSKARHDIEATHELARTQLRVAAERRNAFACVKKVDFDVGEWVRY